MLYLGYLGEETSLLLAKIANSKVADTHSQTLYSTLKRYQASVV